MKVWFGDTYWWISKVHIFLTNFRAKTVSSSQSFWVPWTLQRWLSILKGQKGIKKCILLISETHVLSIPPHKIWSLPPSAYTNLPSFIIYKGRIFLSRIADNPIVVSKAQPTNTYSTINCMNTFHTLWLQIMQNIQSHTRIVTNKKYGAYNTS